MGLSIRRGAGPPHFTRGYEDLSSSSTLPYIDLQPRVVAILKGIGPSIRLLESSCGSHGLFGDPTDSSARLVTLELDMSLMETWLSHLCGLGETETMGAWEV